MAIPDPASICETGKGSAYGHPSNACWMAHDAALNQGEGARALRYVQIGCERYQRSDQCFAMKEATERRTLASTRATGIVRPAAAQPAGPHVIHPADREDGEAGLVFYELLRSRVLVSGK